MNGITICVGGPPMILCRMRFEARANVHAFDMHESVRLSMFLHGVCSDIALSTLSTPFLLPFSLDLWMVRCCLSYFPHYYHSSTFETGPGPSLSETFRNQSPVSYFNYRRAILYVTTEDILINAFFDTVLYADASRLFIAAADYPCISDTVTYTASILPNSDYEIHACTA